MKNIDIKVLFKKLSKKGPHKSVQNSEMVIGAPYRDWQVIVIVFILINVVIVFISLYLFRQVNIGEAFLTPKKVTPTGQSLDKQKLDSITSEFQDRQRSRQ